MQTNEVKAAACVLKQAFFIFERILGLVGPGSKAFVLYALNAAEIRKKKRAFISCLSNGKEVCSWTVQVKRGLSIKGKHYSQKIVGST